MTEAIEPTPGLNLREAWEAEALNWIAWARRPGHDTYWQFHRDAFLATLPPPPRRVVDVGCGEGRFPRDLKRLGYEVIGVDASPTLVAAAREEDPAGDYRLGDAASLPIPDDSADLVTALLSLQDVDDIDSALREAARVLVPGGRLRAAVVHPINSAGLFAGQADDAVFEIRGSYFDEQRFRETVQRDGLTMTFASAHRPLERLARAILATRLCIDHVGEIADTADPPGSRWRRLPLFLHLGAVKPRA